MSGKREFKDAQLVLELYRLSDGRRLARRPVPASELEPLREQHIFNAQRRDKLPLDADTDAVHEVPVFRVGESHRLESLVLQSGEGSSVLEWDVGLKVFEPLAQRVAAELFEKKQVDAKAEVRYAVFVDQIPTRPHESGVTVRRQQQPLPVIDGLLEAWTADAEIEGPELEEDYPVIVMEDALSAAKEITWQRNKERGVWLIGHLYRQPGSSPEIFGVIHTAIEARGAAHERFGLVLSEETYLDADRQLERRRDLLGYKGELKMGVFHTHPFLPSIVDGREACPACELRAECKLTSSFFSQKDAQFHAAMFGRAPYAVEMVLGLTPREEFDLKMFCMDRGRFRERGYYRLASAPSAVSSP